MTGRKLDRAVVWSRKLASIDQGLREVEQARRILTSRRDQLLSQSKVICQFCKAKIPVKDLTYIQTHFYVPPSGCTEGAYWLPGEGQFFCPSCNSLNRLIDIFGTEEVNKLKRFFGKIKDAYDLQR